MQRPADNEPYEVSPPTKDDKRKALRNYQSALATVKGADGRWKPLRYPLREQKIRKEYPGRNRFRREADIKESHTHDRYLQNLPPSQKAAKLAANYGSVGFCGGATYGFLASNYNMYNSYYPFRVQKRMILGGKNTLKTGLLIGIVGASYGFCSGYLSPLWTFPPF